MSVIVSIGTALPTNCFKQSLLSGFMAELFQLNANESRALRMMYTKSGISHRYSAIPDFSLEAKDWTFFPKKNEDAAFPSIEKRMSFYMEHAVPLGISAIENCITNKIEKKKITHLITVSCTGMSAPGIDIEIVQQLELDSNIDRTSINFMGCYAAVHALKQANAIVKSNPKAIVLIVSVELCTLHFQKVNNHENHTANLLFADGAAAALIVSEAEAKRQAWHGFKIESFYSALIYQGKADMAWHLTSNGFLMSLSSYIPALIEQDFKSFFEASMQKANLSLQQIKYWAIHPGGRRILEVVSDSLGLQSNDLLHSYEVLNNYGNMSSPTILFVLKSMMEAPNFDQPQGHAFGAAFGPGLTLESVILAHV
jgi:prepilin-type processing-associated H-X9-DG protein